MNPILSFINKVISILPFNSGREVSNGPDQILRINKATEKTLDAPTNASKDRLLKIESVSLLPSSQIKMTSDIRKLEDSTKQTSQPVLDMGQERASKDHRFYDDNFYFADLEATIERPNETIISISSRPLKQINLLNFLSLNSKKIKPLDWVLTKFKIPIPPDIWKKITQYLDRASILSLRSTCKALEGLNTDPYVQNSVLQNQKNELENQVYGKTLWNQFIGDIGEVPSLPKEFVMELEKPCPFSCDPNVKVKDTHVVIWIPEKVNGQPLTLNIFKKFMKISHILKVSPNNVEIDDRRKKSLWGDFISERYNTETPLKEWGDLAIKKSGWFLFTKEIIQGSANKSFDEQKVLIEKHPSYEVPTLQETCICQFLHYLKTAENLYPFAKRTRCQEKYKDTSICVHAEYREFLGYLQISPEIIHGDWNMVFLGMAGMRRF